MMTDQTPVVPQFDAADQYFQSITPSEVDRHVNLWHKLVPSTPEQIFCRYLFAFLSVHTTWERNVNAYIQARNFNLWTNNIMELYALLVRSGIGLQNLRVRFISQFAQSFWSDPSFYTKHETETWLECRKRIEARISGLGLAKSSFALEMVYPMSAEVVCLDTHMFQLYGLNQNKHKRFYKTLEQHWINCCKQIKLPSYIARAICWNRNQNQADCTYWCHVFMDQ